jgi:signal peptide peptidase SppA
MKKNLVLAAVLAQPWALMPEYMQSMAGAIARWHADVPMSAETTDKIRADQEARAAARGQAQQRAGGGSIALINVFGVLPQRGNMMDDLSGPGSCSTEMLISALRSAETDDTVGQILMNFSTPGGSVYGIVEAAAEINRIKAIKPIVGIANSMCASAGYWLMSQCSVAYCTPGGEVGSIGVWQAHEDMSKALDDAGVAITLISSGKFKVEGNPYTPLDDEARAFMQLRTDQYYDAFVKAVAKGRGVGVASVRDGMGQGRVLGADDALAQNMIDGVATIDDVVKKMQRNAKAGGSGARSAEVTPGPIVAGAVIPPVVPADPGPAAGTLQIEGDGGEIVVATPPSRVAAMLREAEIAALS